MQLGQQTNKTKKTPPKTPKKKKEIIKKWRYFSKSWWQLIQWTWDEARCPQGGICRHSSVVRFVFKLLCLSVTMNKVTFQKSSMNIIMETDFYLNPVGQQYEK